MRLKEHKTIKENMESKMGFQRGESWSSGRVGTTFGGMLPAQKKKKNHCAHCMACNGDEDDFSAQEDGNEKTELVISHNMFSL